LTADDVTLMVGRSTLTVVDDTLAIGGDTLAADDAT
jgi:hypothetical protein